MTEEDEMQALEWTTVDKSAWQRGEWDDEPDKRQWRDEATDLPCLIVRGPGGFLCGYVGVGPNHPLYGKHYDAEEVAIDIHGGLTFASRCADFSREAYEKWQRMIEGGRDEAKRYPMGDAAERLKTAARIDSFDAWVAHFQQRSICHLVEAGEPDDIWWFGFDCGHAGDYSPKFDREEYGALRLGAPTGWGGHIEYRNLAYVTQQVTDLARQLAAKASA